MIKETFKYRIYRKVMFCTGMIMLLQLIFPTVTWALTSGPSQPEFSSFEPVATTNMVNEFSGDFTYNLPVVSIPGANGGGYDLSLSYHSGASPEEEASWVGYGWTLNPGAISRGKRGLPDDDNATEVKYWNKVPSNKTASLGAAVSVEGFSTDLPLSLNASLRYNNYKGFGYTAGAGVRFNNGLVSLGYSVSDGEGSFSVTINPLANMNSENDKHAKGDKKQAANKEKKSMTKEERRAASKKIREQKNEGAHGFGAMSLAGSKYGLFSYGDAVRPVTLTAYRGQSYNLGVSLLASLTPFQVGPTFDINGSYTWQQNVNNAGQPGAASSTPVYGYLYSDRAGASGNSMMDYYTEKLNPYDKRDRYLGIPFSNADAFNVAGEGIGGGFRLYNRNAGHFRPNSVHSHTEVFNLGAEVEAGLNIGGGADIGVGFQQVDANSWDNNVINNNTFANYTNSDEPYFFRFSNDMGGSVEYGNNDAPQRASFSGESPNVNSIVKTMNNGSRSGRSSYIAYHTNSEMQAATSGPDSKRYKSYSMSNDVESLVDRTTMPDQIGELTVFNEDGMRYIYGLPVYSRKEGQLQYDLNGVPASKILNNYLAYRDVSNVGNLKSKVGEERDLPYATQYLLTEITSPDYVDRTMNGPSDDDFGGYTRFSYDRVYGSTDKTDYGANWFKWRIPYNGLLYSRGELSTQMDDMGTVSYGEKEIYYLDTIVTKTHFAVFFTSPRADGKDALATNTAANSQSGMGSNSLKKLDSIVVFSKNPDGSPQRLKKVCFQYDNSLSSGLPNATGNVGKLTLKKVWFEYEGVKNARIAPYVFDYAYPTAITYAAPYSAFTPSVYKGSKAENPAYSYFNLDAWGNYQENGSTRFTNMKTWVDQNPAATFDPAAWQLKVIKLPTGGEIHVQYEQDDYTYVQDKPVQAMVSLDPGISGMGDELSGALLNKYYLNVGDLGITTTTEKDELVKRINDQYVIPKTKMYFKFLYRLIGLNSPGLDDCNAEYINGYCNVKSAGRDTNGVYVQLGSPTGLSSKQDLPKAVCRDYLKTQRAGNLNLSGQCDGSSSGINTDADPKQVIMQLLGFLTTNFTPAYGMMCTRLNPELSYLRVPMTRAKKGGGVRVKRILMYDAGMETGDASLYGSEYSYTNPDGTSSGVAQNEPGTIREENALIEFDAKLQQSFLSKVISGRDKEQAEKPLGESILPTPSVGYGRVVAKNIYTGKTNPGYSIHEFYTAKDYPMQVSATTIDSRKQYSIIPGGLINIMINNLWGTQGYTFTLNNMHGQKKRDQTYNTDPGTGNGVLSSSQEYTYFEPGEQIPVSDAANAISYVNLGKETELLFESRGMEDRSESPALEFDIDVGIAFIPLPFGSVTPSYTYTESRMYTHVTNRVVTYPAVVKSTLSYADGIYHLSENLAFSRNNGKATITRTSDGYNKLNLQQSLAHQGLYTTYTMPAAYQYDGMGQKSKNERLIIKSDTSTHIIKKMIYGGKYYLSVTTPDGSASCNFGSVFCPGDLIKLNTLSGNNDAGIFTLTDSLSGGNLYMLPTKNYQSTADDNYGTGSDEMIVEVLRSGCTNQLNTTTGEYTTYATGIVSGFSLAARKAFANMLTSLMPSGTISASDPFFGNNPDIRIIDYSDGKCKPFTFPDGSFDATGANETFFKSAAGYIQLVANGYIKLAKDASNYNACYGSGGCNIAFVPTDPYKFDVDPVTGEIGLYNHASCSAYCYFPCITPCPAFGGDTLSNVVAASSKTYNHVWPYDNAVYAPLTGSNAYENGSKGKWRIQSNYVYNDTVLGANSGTQRNYKNAGTFRMQAFNWKNLALNDANKWLKVNTVTTYSPDGNALEEQDIMGIYSAAKFGYDKTQPYLIAKNADYGSVQFESFEKLYNTSQLEDGWAPSGISSKIAAGVAHSGSNSLKLTAGDSIVLKPITLTQQLINAGVSVKVWVRDTLKTTSDNALSGSIRRTVPTGAFMGAAYKKIARSGEWILYEAKITSLASVFSAGDVLLPVIRNNYPSTHAIWLDDIRLQPSDASMTAYVYDKKTMRLITVFDDQHFGLYYQYNAEGKLVRKQIETERGLKTITETQYNTPLQLRP